MRLRPLTAGETALAAEVFASALDTSRLRVLTGAPTFGWAMVVWRVMLFPADVADFSAEPLPRQAWFVHELTHAWQFRHRPIGTLLSWARVAIRGGYLSRSAYAYSIPFDWERLNLEQQAKAVEHAFLLRKGAGARDMPAGALLCAYTGLPFRANL